MNRIVDLFGIDITTNRSVDWKQVVVDQHCPFSGEKCFKIRKSQPSISIGTCTVMHGPDSDPIMICPNRLLERQQIFLDCFHLLERHFPGNELHIVSEVSIPGGSVDYFLVSALEGKVRDFVGIEIQTLDTTGTVWPERQRFLREVGLDAEDKDVSSKKPFGINWKMTAKTILVQLHHKVRTFENLKKHLVLVIQDRFLDYMAKEFKFDHLKSARNSNPMHFHSYNLSKKPDGHRIALDERYSTDTEGIAVCLGLQTEASVEAAEIMAAIEAKISETTLFNISREDSINRNV